MMGGSVNLVLPSQSSILNQDNVTGTASGSGISDPSQPVVTTTSGVDQSMGTTTFVDDAQVVVNDTSYIAHIDNTLLSISNSMSYEQSIIDFLSKPVIVTSGTFSTSDTYSFLNSFLLPYGVFSTSNGLMWKNKLTGFYGARFDMRFRIVVNANKFQQGRYCIGWVPLTGSAHTTSSLKQINFNNFHMGTLVQRTTVHHTEIDLNSMTSAELVVPFQSVRPFYPLINLLTSTPGYELGYLNVYPYSPLVSPAGSTVAGYTVYLSLENIKLFGTASPQSGLSRSQDKELGNKFNGPISGPAMSVAKGFRAFSDIPLVGTYARDISWIADKIARVSSVFGYSKPNQGSSSIKMVQNVGPGNSHVDGDSDAQALSLFNKPGVSPLNGLSGTQLDEMDFSFVARKYAYFRTATWSTTASSGDLVASIQLNPFDAVVVNSGVYNFPPVAFVSTLFEQWRGGLKYRFKIVKTDFHSGRLMISHFPGMGAYDDAPSGSPEYVNRVIIDIRETQEFEIIVPFMYKDLWASFGSYVGKLRINVLDSLVAPATVSSSVTLLMEIAGADDFEVSIPSNDRRWVPTLVTPQSGLSNTSRIYSSTIGDSSVNGDSVAATALAIGDCVTSFRTYIRRFSPISPSNLDNNIAVTEKLNGVSMIMRPDVVLAMSGTTATSDNNFFSDMYGLVASCYGITRGGVRIRDVINGTLSSNYKTLPSWLAVAQLATALDFPDSTLDRVGLSSVNTYANVIDSNNSTMGFQDINKNPVLSYEIPMYSCAYGRSVVDVVTFSPAVYSSATGYNASGDSSCTVPALVITTQTNQSVINAQGYALHNIFRSGADDADFSVFISVPGLLIATVGNNRGGQLTY